MMGLEDLVALLTTWPWNITLAYEITSINWKCLQSGPLHAYFATFSFSKKGFKRATESCKLRQVNEWKLITPQCSLQWVRDMKTHPAVGLPSWNTDAYIQSSCSDLILAHSVKRHPPLVRTLEYSWLVSHFSAILLPLKHVWHILVNKQVIFRPLLCQSCQESVVYSGKRVNEDVQNFKILLCLGEENSTVITVLTRIYSCHS